MLDRYLARVALTSLVLTATLAGASPPPKPVPTCPASLRTRYSARALRRIRILLQLRLLEAHRDRLIAAQAAIEHQVSIDRILAEPDDAAVLAQGSNDARLKHLRLDGTSICW
jgi:hypothetical protein